jgi:hypothetical protein
VTVEAGVLSIRVEQTGADKVASDLGLLDRQLKEMGKQINLFQDGLKFVGTRAGSLRELASIEQQLKGAISSTNTSLEQRIVAEKQLAQIQAGGVTRNETLVGSLKTLALQYFTLQTAMRAAGAVKDVVADAINLGDALHDLSIRTGVSVGTLSVLRLVADKSGGSLEMLATGFKFLNKETDLARTGNKEAILAFRDIGISVDDLRGKNPEQILQLVATGLFRIDDPARRAHDAMLLFGRSGEALLPTLKDLANNGFEEARKRAEELGLVMTDQFANSADAFNDNVRDMKGAVEGLGIAFATVLLPPLTRFVDTLTSALAGMSQLIAKFHEMEIASPKKAEALSSGLAGFLNLVPGGAIIASFLPSKKDIDSSIDAELFSQFNINAASTRKTKPPPRATGDTTAADRARDRAIEKALGLSLGNIPLGGFINADDTTQTLGKLGFGIGGTPTVGVDKNGKMKGVKGDPAKMLADAILGSDEKIRAEMERKREFIAGLVGSVAQTVGSAFGDAFTAAFSGDDNIFAAFGESLIKGLGNIVMQLGEQLLAYGLIISPLASLLSFTPFGGLGLGAGASIAAGLSLTALGAGMGAIGGKGGGGHGGGSSGGRGASTQPGTSQWSVAFDPDKKGRAVVPGTRSIDGAKIPGAHQPIVNNWTIIGPDDPSAQRSIKKLLYNADRRGVTGR